MANHNVSSNAESNPSSVLFNLRDLMRIEEERVAAETAAEVAMREAAKRKREAEQQDAARKQEQARQAALDEQTRVQREQAQADLARDVERERVLARVRLEVETAANAERRQRELEHALALQRLEDASRKRLTTHATVLMAVVTGLVGIAGYTLANRSATQVLAVETGLPAATSEPTTPVAPAEREVAVASEVPVTVADTSASTEPTATKPTVESERPATRRRALRRAQSTRAATTAPLTDVLDNDSDDPLLGMR